MSETMDYQSNKLARKHEEITTDDEEHGTTTTKKPRAQKAAIPSVIVKEVEDIVDDAKKLNEFIEENITKHQLNVKSIRVTRNKNIQIYFEDAESYSEVVENEAIFEGKYKAKTDNKPYFVVLKGLNYQNALVYKQELEVKYNIKEIKQIKSMRTPNQVINKVILAVENKESADSLIRNGIRLSYIRYRIEEYRSPIKLIQCFKCQGFNHIAKNCKKEKTICPKCGSDNHPIDEQTNKPICNAEKKQCINCGNEHSSAAPFCPKKQERLQYIKAKISNNKQDIIIPTTSTSNSKLSYASILKTTTSKVKEATHKIQEQDMLQNIDIKMNQMLKNQQEIINSHEKRILKLEEINEQLQKRVVSLEEEILKQKQEQVEVNSQSINYIIDIFSNLSQKNPEESGFIKNLKAFIANHRNSFNINDQSIKEKLSKAAALRRSSIGSNASAQSTVNPATSASTPINTANKATNKATNNK